MLAGALDQSNRSIDQCLSDSPPRNDYVYFMHKLRTNWYTNTTNHQELECRWHYIVQCTSLCDTRRGTRTKPPPSKPHRYRLRTWAAGKHTGMHAIMAMQQSEFFINSPAARKTIKIAPFLLFAWNSAYNINEPRIWASQQFRLND
jgi:hypothetical protein